MYTLEQCAPSSICVAPIIGMATYDQATLAERCDFVLHFLVTLADVIWRGFFGKLQILLYIARMENDFLYVIYLAGVHLCHGRNDLAKSNRLAGYLNYITFDAVESHRTVSP